MVSFAGASIAWGENFGGRWDPPKAPIAQLPMVTDPNHRDGTFVCILVFSSSPSVFGSQPRQERQTMRNVRMRCRLRVRIQIGRERLSHMQMR
jgi:hypothetical protein